MPRTFVHLHAWRLRGLIRTTACAAACMLIAAAPASQAGPGAQAARPQVLVLMSYHPGHSWEDRILAGLNEWGGNGPAKPVFHTEWMDTKRYPGMEQRQRLARYLRDKYAHQRFDLIATVDDNALEFVARQDALFGGTPVVFSGINGDPAQIVGDRPKVTGILERFDLTRTLRTALSLHPGTRHLVFITPQDETGAELRNGVDTALALLPPGPQVEHWIAPDLSRIGERLQQQPRDTLVFVLGSIPAQVGECLFWHRGWAPGKIGFANVGAGLRAFWGAGAVATGLAPNGQAIGRKRPERAIPGPGWADGRERWFPLCHGGLRSAGRAGGVSAAYS